MSVPVDRGVADAGYAPSLDRFVEDVRAFEILAKDWPRDQRAAVEARIQAEEAINAEAFRRLIRALRLEPGTRDALREAAGDELVYAVLRRHGVLKPSLHEQVEAALETVRPALASHGGDVELVAVDGEVARVRLLGACDGCPASALTFYAGVKKAIVEQVPRITEVRQARGLGSGVGHDAGPGADPISPFAGTQTFVDVGPLEGLVEGQPALLELAGDALLLTRFGDRVTCFENACAHLGLPLDDGVTVDGILTCPHHGFRYSLDTGACLTAPDVALSPREARVDGERVQVRVAS